MDARLQALTAKNGGFFTRGQALDSGWLDRELAEARKLGVVRRLGQGLYSPAEIYDHLSDEARHVLRARAMLGRQWGDAVLAGPSAAAFHGLSIYGYDLSLVHLLRLDGGSARHRAGICHHTAGDDLEHHVVVRDGVRVTSVARTVWDLAASGSLESGVVLADSALRLYRGIEPELDELREAFAFRPGSRCARHVLALADHRSESAGESLSRVGFHRNDVPMPEPQHRIHDAYGTLIAVTDFFWEPDRHVGEFDGKAKYGRLLRPGETPGEAVFREKRREDLVRHEDLGMSRWIWFDVMPTQIQGLMTCINLDRARSRKLYARNRVVIS